jgi:DNA (cytosine-5)-methyltransferase 1
MKILNLFSGIGGNRMLWKDHNVTAVEIHKGVAKYYKEEFPDDEVIIADAYTFLEDNYTEFDFIWASPPCKTHSLLQCKRSKRKYNKVYDYDKVQIPDMRLYGIIIFLDNLFLGDWVVENVHPYYEPLIKPTAKIGRHYIWSNKYIKSKKSKPEHYASIKKICDAKGLDYDKITKHSFGSRKDTILHNCMKPELGKYILEQIIKENEIRGLTL